MDVGAWAALRAALWTDTLLNDHLDEINHVLTAGDFQAVAFVATEPNGICGFAEASLRRDHVNGCRTSPVAFLEGIYVVPDQRGNAVGQALCAAVEAWGRNLGCRELASDALLDNDCSHAFHRAVGFEETERIVYFRKQL